jgi:hypothetical protein
MSMDIAETAGQPCPVKRHRGFCAHFHLCEIALILEGENVGHPRGQCLCVRAKDGFQGAFFLWGKIGLGAGEVDDFRLECHAPLLAEKSKQLVYNARFRNNDRHKKIMERIVSACLVRFLAKVPRQVAYDGKARPRVAAKVVPGRKETLDRR